MKVFINGNTVKFKSQLTKSQFMKAKKYSPELLVLKDEKDNEKFRMSFRLGNTNPPEDFGLAYGSIDFDDHIYLQFANAIQHIHDDPEVEKLAVAEAFSTMIMNANAVEKKVLMAMADLDQVEKDIQDNITVCDANEA